MILEVEMHRIPEKQTGSQTVSDCAQNRFYQYTLLLTCHQTEISWLFFRLFYLLCIIVYLITGN